MKSQKEISGLTSNETKVKNMLHDLYMYFLDNKTHKTDDELTHDRTDVVIPRYSLILQVSDAISKDKAVERHTVSSWIRYLLNQRFLIQNPTSHIIYTGMNHMTPSIMPNNDTRYYINFKLITEKLKELITKEKEFSQKKVTTLPSLDSFSILTESEFNGSDKDGDLVLFHLKPCRFNPKKCIELTELLGNE